LNGERYVKDILVTYQYVTDMLLIYWVCCHFVVSIYRNM